MNKQIYTIFGTDLEGTQQEIFKAGFNENNKPLVTVGDNEVSLDDVISAPSGGTAGQILTKTATAAQWADAPNPVEANPVLSGGETKLNSIKIGDTKFEVGGSGGFPTEATASDAMVYNGQEWVKQSGYAYKTPVSTQTITWNGSKEGKISIAGTYYKVSDVTPSILSIHQGSITYSANGSSIVIPCNTLIVGGSEEDGIYYFYGASEAYLILVFNDNRYSPGIYFYNNDYGYISSLTYGDFGTIVPFDQTLTLPTGETNGGLIYNGEWKSTPNYGTYTPESLISSTYNGNPDSKEHFQFDKTYIIKIASSIPSGDQLNAQITYIEDEEISVIDTIFSYIGEDRGLKMYVSEDSEDIQIYVAPIKLTVEMFEFTQGVWCTQYKEEEYNIYVSKLDFNIEENYTQFDTNYIPIKFNQDDAEQYAKTIKFGENNYIVTSIEETKIPNRLATSTSTQGELQWSIPVETSGTITINCDGAKKEFYIRHNFGLIPLSCTCTEVGGSAVIFTGTNINKNFYKITFEIPPESGKQLLVEIKPQKIIETMTLGINEYDILPMTQSEAEELGFIIEEG